MFQQLVSIFVLVTCFIIPDFSYAIDPNGTTMGRLKSSPFYAKLVSDVQRGWEDLNTNEQKRLLTFMKRTLTKADNKLDKMKEDAFSKRMAKVVSRSTKEDESKLGLSEEGKDYNNNKSLFAKLLSKSSLKDLTSDASVVKDENSSREALSKLRKDDFQVTVREALYEVDSMLNAYASNTKRNSRFPAQTSQTTKRSTIYTILIIVFGVLALLIMVAITALMFLGLPVIAAVHGVLLALFLGTMIDFIFNSGPFLFQHPLLKE